MGTLTPLLLFLLLLLPFSQIIEYRIYIHPPPKKRKRNIQLPGCNSSLAEGARAGKKGEGGAVPGRRPAAARKPVNKVRNPAAFKKRVWWGGGGGNLIIGGGG